MAFAQHKRISERIVGRNGVGYATVGTKPNVRATTSHPQNVSIPLKRVCAKIYTVDTQSSRLSDIHVSLGSQRIASGVEEGLVDPESTKQLTPSTIVRATVMSHPRFLREMAEKGNLLTR